MSNMNFFGWIRDGVRQSVLLGVSDAVEQLGSPAATEDLHPSVAGFLKVEQRSAHVPKIGQHDASNTFNATAAKSRKRLGKSLKDIGPQPTEAR